MRALARVLRSPVWLALLWLIGGAQVAAAADAWVVADFDGDGHRDRAALDRRDPSLLRVWLSTTRSTALVHNTAPVVGIGAHDLDGDRRAELIVGTRLSGLRVWTTRRHGFSPFRSWRMTSGALALPSHHGVDDEPIDRPAAVGSEAPTLRLAVTSTLVRAPIPIAAVLPPCLGVDLRSALLLAPSGPRPPPVRC
jgi:hypothetical protein